MESYAAIMGAEGHSNSVISAGSTTPRISNSVAVAVTRWLRTAGSSTSVRSWALAKSPVEIVAPPAACSCLRRLSRTARWFSGALIATRCHFPSHRMLPSSCPKAKAKPIPSRVWRACPRLVSLRVPALPRPCCSTSPLAIERRIAKRIG